MVQTVVIVILLALDAAIVLSNQPAFQGAMTLNVPGLSGQPIVVAMQMLMTAAGAALVLAWIAALVDRAALDRRVQNDERTMRVMSDEMQRVKAKAYDQERQPLEDIRTKLETLDRDIRGLRARLDREPLAKPVDALPKTADAVR